MAPQYTFEQMKRGDITSLSSDMFTNTNPNKPSNLLSTKPNFQFVQAPRSSPTSLSNSKQSHSPTSLSVQPTISPRSISSRSSSSASDIVTSVPLTSTINASPTNIITLANGASSDA